MVVIYIGYMSRSAQPFVLHPKIAVKATVFELAA